ncbi:MAG: hypothetical protein GF401_08135 [Chitinivibrionales bacterium]|nr:hypothetical protein [Chitinivibrionales bacterium]
MKNQKIIFINIFQRFLNTLNTDNLSQICWNRNNLEPWTAYASEIFARILQDDFKLEAARKGHADKYGRYEYFNIDVIAYDDCCWKPPIIAIEIENYFSRIEYSAWKLFSVDCRFRLLLTYYYPKANSKYFAKNLADIKKKISPIADDNKRKPLLLIYGNGAANPRKQSWDKIFKTYWF